MKDDALLKEVQEIIEKLKPEWGSGLSHCHKDSDFVRESIFVVGHCRIIWIVLLAHGGFAYKLISAEGLELYEELILESPQIFVEFDRCFQILKFLAAQDKVVPVDD